MQHFSSCLRQHINIIVLNVHLIGLPILCGSSVMDILNKRCNIVNETQAKSICNFLYIRTKMFMHKESRKRFCLITKHATCYSERTSPSSHWYVAHWNDKAQGCRAILLQCFNFVTYGEPIPIERQRNVPPTTRYSACRVF